MILVTGAAGKTGRAVIRALAAGRQPVRALVHRPEQVAWARGLGAAEVVVGDMRLEATWGPAVQQVRALYHICPNVNPDEVMMGQLAIQVAVAAGVDHFVYHSVLHPQLEAMPHHWLKLRVEELLLESGLSYTILQPAAYMQNLMAHWDRILEDGVYPIPYPAETRLSLVDLDDVAEVAAQVLGRAEHAGAIYQLVGTEPLSQMEVAGVLSAALERPVRVQEIPIEVWEQDARRAGLGDYQVDTLIRMFGYYGRHGFWGNSHVLGWLLGRCPTTLAAFVERVRCFQS